MSDRDDAIRIAKEAISNPNTIRSRRILAQAFLVEIEEKREKVFCKDCTRWYCTKADQCDIPNPGIEMTSREFSTDYFKAVGAKPIEMRDKKLCDFLKENLTFIHGYDKKIFGHPSQLNKNNDCPFFKRSWGWAKFFRWLS